MAIPDSQGYPEKINQMLTIKKNLIIFKYNFSKNFTRAFCTYGWSPQIMTAVTLSEKTLERYSDN